jgi:hypothetical protein
MLKILTKINFKSYFLLINLFACIKHILQSLQNFYGLSEIYSSCEDEVAEVAEESTTESKTITVEINLDHLMNCVMRHFVEHKSKWQEIESILRIFNDVAKKKIVGSSKHTFMKHFEKKMTYFFYVICTNTSCQAINKIKAGSGIKKFTCKDKKCSTISNVADAKVAFVCFELESQLREILERYKDVLILPEKPSNMEDFPIADVWDSKLHREILSKTKLPFISLTLNTDGVQVFKSNTTSLWPIILSVNNLPLGELLSRIIY